MHVLSKILPVELYAIMFASPVDRRSTTGIQSTHNTAISRVECSRPTSHGIRHTGLRKTTQKEASQEISSGIDSLSIYKEPS